MCAVEQRVRVGECPGIVRFVGSTEFSRGTWVGVELDRVEGKNNGTVQGVQYFRCDPNRGIFVRPNKVVAVPLGDEAAACEGDVARSSPSTELSEGSGEESEWIQDSPVAQLDRHWKDMKALLAQRSRPALSGSTVPSQTGIELRQELQERLRIELQTLTAQIAEAMAVAASGACEEIAATASRACDQIAACSRDACDDLHRFILDSEASEKRASNFQGGSFHRADSCPATFGHEQEDRGLSEMPDGSRIRPSLLDAIIRLPEQVEELVSIRKELSRTGAFDDPRRGGEADLDTSLMEGHLPAMAPEGPPRQTSMHRFSAGELSCRQIAHGNGHAAGDLHASELVRAAPSGRTKTELELAAAPTVKSQLGTRGNSWKKSSRPSLSAEAS